MIAFFVKYKKSILIITLVIFIASIGYFGFNSFNMGAFRTVVAKVGDTEISFRDMYRAADMHARALRNNGVEVDENLTQFLHQQALSALISEEVLNQAGKEMGLAVSNYEIAAEIQSAPGFVQNGKFNHVLYEQAVRRQLGVSPAQFEEQLRRDKMGNRFRMAIFSIYKLTPDEVRFSYQIQNGNLKDFEKNKKDFEKQLFETKMETAQRAFMDEFNNHIQIKTFLKDEQA
jgi:peptidyl-prolyl cis-trans isomerase D